MVNPSQKNLFVKRQILKDKFKQLKLKLLWLISRITTTWADEEKKELTSAVREFKQFVFRDPDTGIHLNYNLYLPKKDLDGACHPLVVFIHDMSIVGKDPILALIQGSGGVIWATRAEQAKHPCFVLVPQYSKVIVNDESQATQELDVTVNLIKDLFNKYPIDRNKVYTTGQSMGCMASIEMLIRYPDLFSAALLVAGQWDAIKMSVLKDANMWVVVSEGDRKAFPGMNASMALLEESGAKISRGIWNGQSSQEEFCIEVQKMITEGNHIYYTVLKKGTVVPGNLPDDGHNNHMQTWPIVYQIKALRDWLFTQRKN